MTRNIGHLYKYAISIALLAVLLLRVDFSEVYANLARLSVLSLGFTLLLAISQVFVTSARWYLLLRAMAVRVPFKSAMEANVISIFANTFLVNVIGGAVTRVALLAGLGVSTHKTLATIILERILVFAVLIVMAGTGLWWVRWPLEFGGFPPKGVVLGGIGAVVIAALVLSQSGFMVSFVRRVVSYLALLAVELRDLLSSGRSMALALALTTFNQCLLLAVGVAIAKALSIDVPTFDLLMLLPTVSLLASLPISVGGLGVREISLVFALSAFGVPTEQSLVFSILIGLVSLLGAAGAGMILLGAKSLSRTTDGV